MRIFFPSRFESNLVIEDVDILSAWSTLSTLSIPLKFSSVLKRFLKEPRFAAGTRRDEVKMCELSDGLNIPLEKFIEICLTSMQQIAHQIGL